MCSNTRTLKVESTYWYKQWSFILSDALPNLVSLYFFLVNISHGISDSQLDHSIILLSSLVLISSLSMFVATILTSFLVPASSMDSLISTILHSFLPIWTLSLVVIHVLPSNPLFAWILVNFYFFSRTVDSNLPLGTVTASSSPTFKFNLKYPPVSQFVSISWFSIP